MNGYVISIIIVSIVGGIASSLISMTDNRFKKQLSFIISLIYIIVLIAPVKNAINNIKLFSENIDTFISSLNTNIDYSNNLIINSSIDNISIGIKNELLKEFSLKSDDVKVTIDVNTDNIEAVKIEAIKIFLYNEATWHDEEKIINYLDKLLGCKIIIKKE